MQEHPRATWLYTVGDCRPRALSGYILRGCPAETGSPLRPTVKGAGDVEEGNDDPITRGDRRVLPARLGCDGLRRVRVDVVDETGSFNETRVCSCVCPRSCLPARGRLY